jgi:hypothetical protein
MDGDPRFAAAAGGVARYFADEAGLEAPEVLQWQGAATAACDKSFELLSLAHPRLEVVFTRFSDRIEMTLRVAGSDEAARKPNFLGDVPGIDQVCVETHNGTAVACLTKYVRVPS